MEVAMLAVQNTIGINLGNVPAGLRGKAAWQGCVATDRGDGSDRIQATMMGRPSPLSSSSRPFISPSSPGASRAGAGQMSRRLTLFVGTIRTCLRRAPGWLRDVFTFGISCRTLRTR